MSEISFLVHKLFNSKGFLTSLEWKSLISSMQQNPSQRSELLHSLEEFCDEVITHITPYSQLCDLLRELIHQYRYDMEALHKLYKISGHISLHLFGVILSAQQSLTNLIVWKNLPFWLDSTLHLIDFDNKVIDLIYSELSTTRGVQLANQYTLSCTIPQLKEVMSFMRIISIVNTMKMLKIDKESIESFLRAIASQLRIKDLHENKRQLLETSIYNLLKLLLKSLPLHMDINGGIFYRPDVHNAQLSYLSINSEKESTRYDMGRSVFIDLFYGCTLMAIREYKSNRRVSNKAYGYRNNHCICGVSMDGRWKMVGQPSPEEVVLMQQLKQLGFITEHSNSILSDEMNWEMLPNVICESCYRTLRITAHGWEAGLTDVVDVACCPFTNPVESGNADSGIVSIEKIRSPPPVPAARALSPLVSVASAALGSRRSSAASIQSDCDNDDVSVLSGVSHLNVHDDDSSSAASSSRVSKKVQSVQMDPVKFNENEFAGFVANLWTGIPIILIYSYEPLVEKNRLLYLSSSDPSVSEVLQAKLANRGFGLDHQFYRWLASKVSVLYLGWAHLSEMKNLRYNPKKSLALAEINKIKVGSAKQKNCIKIGSAKAIIVMKIEQEEKVPWLVIGLTQLIAFLTNSHK